MSKSDAWEHAYLMLVFNNMSVAGIGDAIGIVGSAVAGDFYVSMHTADPGEAGDQTTSEVAYPGYARAAVARDGTGFTITGSVMNPAGPITFPEGGAGTSGTATHFGLGSSNTGAGLLLYSGPITPNLILGEGVSPQFGVGSSITED